MLVVITTRIGYLLILLVFSLKNVGLSVAIGKVEPLIAFPTRVPTMAPTSCIYGSPMPSIQLSALYDIYNSTNGENWKYGALNGAPWDFSQPDPNPCTEGWAYISCDTPCSTVRRLQFDTANTNGTIPSSIGNITTLQVSID